MIGSSTQKTNQTTTSAPWAPAQAGLQGALSGAQNWMNNWQNLQYFNQPSTAATLTPLQNQAIQQTADIANNGQNAAGVGSAANLENDILQGKYLNAGNPNQNALNTAITNATLPAINATFSNAGRTGSGLNQYAVASGLGAALAQPQYQNYQYEQGLQQNAAGQTPGLAQAAYINPNNLYAAGTQQQQQNQQQLDAAFNAWQYNQQRQLMALQQAAGIMTPIGGLGSTSNTQGTTQTSMNPFTAIMGGVGLAGALGAPNAQGVSAFGNIASGLGNIGSGLGSAFGSLTIPAFL